MYADPVERVRVANRRRRAMKRSVPSAPYTLAGIAERDRYCCQVEGCGLPVDMGLPYSDPMAPSIDHRTPMSKGGYDTPANVQLAHRACNLRKGARINGR